MRQLFTFYTAILFSASSFAQPILTRENSAPVIGENFTYKKIGWDGNPGSAGANQVWDFSNISLLQTTYINHVSPNGAPYNSYFPEATLVTNYWSGEHYEFMKVSDTVSECLGVSTANVYIPYYDNEKSMVFPLTYNDSYVDSFAANFTYNNASFQRRGKISVDADAYGELILPHITYTGVLRVTVNKSFTTTQMNIFPLNPVLNESTIYYFYKTGTKTPVLTFTETPTFLNGYYLIHPSLAGTQKLTEDILPVYPNPASSELMIPENSGDFTIYNTDGKNVFSSEGEVQTIDISRFEKGLYLIRFEEKNNVQRFVKQ